MTSDGKLTGLDFSGKINIVAQWTVDYRQTDEFNQALEDFEERDLTDLYFVNPETVTNLET